MKNLKKLKILLLVIAGMFLFSACKSSVYGLSTGHKKVLKKAPCGYGTTIVVP
ncbi:MAG: hypothetical protein GXP45_02410 [bacterium]|nr:hypothetical protein [bacterium]